MEISGRPHHLAKPNSFPLMLTLTPYYSCSLLCVDIHAKGEALRLFAEAFDGYEFATLGWYEGGVSVQALRCMQEAVE